MNSNSISYTILFILLFTSCKSKQDIATEFWWKYGDGNSISDVLDFSSPTDSIDKQLNIYKKQQKVAKVIEIKNHKMTIKTLDNKKGNYSKKGKTNKQSQ